MLKKTMLVFALMALIVGALLAQPMRVEKNNEIDGGRRDRTYRAPNNMRGNNHQRAIRENGMRMNHRKGDHKMKDMNSGRMILAMAEELELTDTQIKNIKAIQANFRKVRNTKQAEIENLLIDKREAMRDHRFKDVTKTVKDIYKLKEEIALENVTAIEDIYNKLTKDQQDLLKTNCKNK